MSDTIQMWASIAAFAALGLGIVIWVASRLLSRSRLAITPSLTRYRNDDAIELKVRNLRSGTADVRSAYLMFASGAGMALKPVVPGSAPLPLRLPDSEDAFLRYPFADAAQQLSHHRDEELRAVACLVNEDDLVQVPIPAELARALVAGAASVAPAHLLECRGCSSMTASLRR